MWIERAEMMARLDRALERSRVVALVGPRQCGKTTLAHWVATRHQPTWSFDLEDPASLAALAEPMTALRPLTGLVVLDEIQRRPDLFPVLRVLADRSPLPARFLVLGSASPALLNQASESLAGRLELVELSGFNLREVGAGSMDTLWLAGGFPPAFTAPNLEDSFEWRRQLVLTFLERDLPIFGIKIPSSTLLRFWTMLAHYHGQIWNSSVLARSLGVNEKTVVRYLDVLESFFMVRVLRPWHANLGKRQVKSPKVYFRDSGILHALLGIRTRMELLSHPKCGASWEGWALDECITRARPDEAFFWGTHGGAEIDLVLVKEGRRFGVECKRSDAPRLTPSLREALIDLDLERAWVIYPGDRRYAIADKVEAVPMNVLAGPDWDPLRTGQGG